MWRLTILFLLFLNVSQLSGQCVLFNLVAEPHTCDESDMFLLDFEFEYVGVSDSFVVSGNGIVHGVFAYGEVFYTVGPFEGDCVTEYELVVTDQEVESCQDVLEIGTICCGEAPCEIGELSVEVGECNDADEFAVFINFEYSGVSDSFRVAGNGNQYGNFAYTDLPIEILNLEGNCDLNYEFVVIDLENETCAADVGIGVVCCGEGPCEIGELSVEIGDCNPNDIFYMFLNFEYSGVSELFQVQGNGVVYGQYSYSDLPIELGPFAGDCETDYELVVVDVENEACNSVVELGTICCGEGPCEIGELSVEVGECNDADEFAVFINFEYSGVSDSFRVAGNGNQYGNFAYTDLPIEISNLEGNCDLNYEFVVIDLENETCVADVGIGVVCCGEGPCEIGELSVEIGDCNPNDIFYMFLNFEYSGVSELFQVQGNGEVYGQYSYNDLPIELGPFAGDCETDYELVVVDVENEACNSVVELGTICCGEAPCEIGELSVEVGECNDADEFAVFINFEYSGVSDSFRVAGNGNQYGNFAYADLPIEISNLEGNCDLNYEFVVIDLDDETCAADIGIGEVCCGEDDCEISELLIVPTECDDEGEFYAVILFEYEGTSESFSVLGNGNNYGTYEYEDLPIAVGPLDADCDTDYEFVIVDQSQESCIEEYELGTVCCEECEIGEIDVISAECEGEVSFVEIDFDYVGVTDLGFDVFIGDDFYGFFSYETLPLTLEIEGNEAPNYALTICENDRPDCCSTIEVDNPCYTTDVKEIWLDQIKLVYGDEGYYVLNQNSVKVDFNIYAIDGKLIYNDNLGAFAQKAIEVNAIPAGLYIIRFQSGMRYKMDKLIVER